VNIPDLESVVGDIGEVGDWVYGDRLEGLTSGTADDGSWFSISYTAGVEGAAEDIQSDGGSPVFERSP